MNIFRLLFAGLFSLGLSAALAADSNAARQLAKENNCFRCHAVEREKDGPAWTNIGAKYRQVPDGERKLMTHLTTAPKIRLIEQGIDEDHVILKYRDEAELKNLVAWILSL